MKKNDDIKDMSLDELLKNIKKYACPICGRIGDKTHIHRGLVKKAQQRLGFIEETCFQCPCLFHSCAGKTDENNLRAVKKDKYFPGEPLCGPNGEMD